MEQWRATQIGKDARETMHWVQTWTGCPAAELLAEEQAEVPAVGSLEAPVQTSSWIADPSHGDADKILGFARWHLGTNLGTSD